MHDAIHISDLHLGSDLCHVVALEHFLGHLPPTRRLILGGDVLEATDHRLRRKHWHVLSLLRKLSDDVEVIWIRGNHDHDAEAVAHLIGAAWYKECYAYTSGEKMILCTHGDQWDEFIRQRPILTWLADRTYLLAQKIAPDFAHYLKHSSKTYLRCTEKVKAKALRWGHGHGADMVVCGHTHAPELLGEYANTGSWTDHRLTFLTMTDGEGELQDYPNH